MQRETRYIYILPEGRAISSLSSDRPSVLHFASLFPHRLGITSSYETYLRLFRSYSTSLIFLTLLSSDLSVLVFLEESKNGMLWFQHKSWISHLIRAYSENLEWALRWQNNILNSNSNEVRERDYTTLSNAQSGCTDKGYRSEKQRGHGLGPKGIGVLLVTSYLNAAVSRI